MKKNIPLLLLTLLFLVLAGSIVAINLRYEKKYYGRMLHDDTRWTTIEYWKTDGQLEKVVQRFEKKGRKRQQNIAYYKEGQEVMVNGEKYTKQELDFEKSKLNIPEGHTPACNAVYSKNKQVAIREIDENGDGKIDGRSYYRDNIVYKSEDSSKEDGRIDMWQHYDENGKLSYSEYDSDGDGKPDKRGTPPSSTRNLVINLGDV